jgi:hypothetical protein
MKHEYHEGDEAKERFEKLATRFHARNVPNWRRYWWSAEMRCLR